MSEPWTIQYVGDDCIIFDNDGGLVETFYGLDGKHRARRVVACVNACAGISTEALESGTRLQALCHVTKQRNDLLAALEGAKSKLDASTRCHPSAVAFLVSEAHEIVDAAIADANAEPKP